MNIKSIILSAVGVIVGISCVPIIWDAVYNESAIVTGTAATLLHLVPFIYVGAIVIGGLVYAVKGE